MTARVVVLTREPTPGRVKTRLHPALGPAGAAALHAALVERTLRTCAASGLPTTVALDGRLDGAVGTLARALGFTVQAQVEGDLGARLRAALVGPERLVCVGTDCPGLQPAHLLQAAASSADLVFGPALDGGYWLVAFDGAEAGAPAGHVVLDGVEWSSDRVLAQSVARARQAGLTVALLEPLRDLDTPADLVEYAADPRCPAALLPLLRA